jgi:hypothetical protein
VFRSNRGRRWHAPLSSGARSCTPTCPRCPRFSPIDSMMGSRRAKSSATSRPYIARKQGGLGSSSLAPSWRTIRSEYRSPRDRASYCIVIEIPATHEILAGDQRSFNARSA